MPALQIILSLFLFPSVTSAVESCRNVYSQSGYALIHHAYKSFFTRRLASCYMSCNTQPTCQSLNYNLADKTCELNNDIKYFRPKYFVKKPAFVYAENPDSETPWRKLNSAPVCFGAKDNQFGRFRVEVGGSIQAVKLVHVSGAVNCYFPRNASSKWGCDLQNVKQYIFVLLTDTSNTILLPMGQSHGSRYTLPGYDAQSSEIIFTGFPNPLYLSSGQELRVWYEEDLKDQSEHDNSGTSCTDVFAKYL
ncbi:PREDICTED: uncharacterized protein LOC107339768 isoform X2 [Acropora digitifera]|uniref:uncharacterized protein LOC107339768 isoform X2 n=1 Tax=Acropora digitifera TaxID=70779 RepID=UPI00077AA5F7|nr:PREDICTED: uncharacterized protein LOC107339768 isoform X2 [Acropora digitifera]